MPIHGYPGNVITANPTAPTSSVATGVWTTEQQLLAVSQGNWPGYEYPLANSLRFSSARSAYLSRTPASAGNRRTFTWSGWVKRSALSGSTRYFLFAAGSFAGSTNTSLVILNDSINIYWGGTGGPQWTTTAVLRDPSAWYHIVYAVDTTQATFGNRLKVYVNGVQLTAWSLQETGGLTAQNSDLYINNNQQHNLGASGTPGNYFDGYMTEINFIDGQALEPSSFGLNDPETGVWSPKRYTGTYGTNGFYLPMTTEGQWSGYLDGSGDDLTAPSNAAFTYGTGDFTIEGFFFFTGGVGAGGYSYLFAQGGVSGSNSTIGVYAQSGVYKVWNGSTVITGTAAFAQNQWVHIALTRSGTNLRLFVNGVLDGSATNSNSIASGGTSGISIGRWRDISDTNYITGYVSNFRVVKGTAVYTSAFTPPTSQLTAITNTSLLTCQSSTFIDNSTNAFTVTANGDARPQQFSPFADSIDDRSGQGNHWIPNNLDLRTAGAGADIMVDVPTSYGTDTGVGGEVRGNYCTWNSLVPGWSTSLSTYAEANLSVYGNNTQRAIGTQQVPATGKWYFEIRGISYGTGGSAAIGVTTSASDPTVTTAVLYQTDGTRYLNGSSTSYGATWGSPSGNTDVIGIAVNNDAGTITFYKNNASQGAITHGLGNVLYPVVGKFGVNAGYITANFGQKAFAYTAPSGFKALCTQNLPPVTIGATSTTQANKYMDVTLYTGNQTVRSITNSGSMQPDFVWDKLRSGANSHRLFDAVRGVEKALYSNLTNIEATETGTITAFNSNGFSLGTNTETNTTGSTYVAWQWNAGGSTVTNTSGTISSQVRASTASGFSIVTYTGTGSAGTIGHGLGVTPAMYIVKRRTGGVGNWAVWHRGLSNTTTSYILLDSSDIQNTSTSLWGSTAATATTIGLGTSVTTNNSTDPYVAYCFSAVAGYSAFGSYAANNAVDGVFVYLDFRPEWLMIKRATTTNGNSWVILDAARNTFNVTNNALYANQTYVENGTIGAMPVDFLSNGFKIRTDGSEVNGTGTYIYAAFAESPFKYALAR